MPDENPTRDPVAEDAQVDQAIVASLLTEQLPWSVQEVERQITDPTAATDSLRRLYATGLIHRCGEYVWATRAARLADEIA